MLNDFNLVTASEAYRLSDTDGNTSTAVALPLRQKGYDGQYYPALYADADHDGEGLMNVSSISPEIFNLPKNATFYHFLSTYSLPTVETFQQNMAPFDHPEKINKDPLGLEGLSWKEQFDSLMREDAGAEENRQGVKW